MYPEFVYFHESLALELQMQGKLELALLHYEEVVRINPLSANSYLKMGDIHRQMGFNKFDCALRCYSKAIHLNPMLTEAREKLASLQQMQRERTRELADFFTFMGDLFQLIGGFGNPSSMLFYANAIDICPTFAEPCEKLALILKYRSQIPEAIALFRRALELKPANSVAYCELAQCYLMICDWHDYDDRMDKIVIIVEEQLAKGLMPSVPAHKSMLYPFTLDTRRRIAELNAKQCFVNLDRCGLLHKRGTYVFQSKLQPVSPFLYKVRKILSALYT